MQILQRNLLYIARYTRLRQSILNTGALTRYGSIPIFNQFKKSCLLHTTSRCNKELYTIDKPFKYISQALKVLSQMRTIDTDFDEFEFLDGTRQAIMHVTENLAEGNFDKLEDLTSTEGLEILKELYHERAENSSSLKVQGEDIIVVVPVGLVQDDQNFVNVLVDCCCREPRIVRCSFRRNFELQQSWLVDSLHYSK